MVEKVFTLDTPTPVKVDKCLKLSPHKFEYTEQCKNCWYLRFFWQFVLQKLL